MLHRLHQQHFITDRFDSQQMFVLILIFFFSYGIVALLAPICDGVVSYTLKNNIYAQNTDLIS